MIATVGLWLSVIAAGLWSGLLLTLTTILHPTFVRQPARRSSSASWAWPPQWPARCSRPDSWPSRTTTSS